MQRSLGLRAKAKLAGQAVVARCPSRVLAQHFPDGYGLTPASTHLSFSATSASPRSGAFVVWVILMIAGTSTAVNLTDGLDGLATGAAVMVFGRYVLIGIWQFRQRLRRSTRARRATRCATRSTWRSSRPP